MEGGLLLPAINEIDLFLKKQSDRHGFPIQREADLLRLTVKGK